MLASPTPGAAPTDQTGAPVALEVERVASGLIAPWSLAFAPDGRMFVTERPGRLRVIVNGALQPEPVAVLSDVAATGEGGLLGMALDPDFDTNGWLYLYYTYRSEGQLRNRVVRYVESNNRLRQDTRQVLVDDIPGSGVHNGGRIAFGPDGRLYVTTGDAAVTSLAQDRASLAGKILRIEADGAIPNDNPFPGSSVYSYGHRNPQGLAWQPGTDRLYATEHGPSANDEVNLIEAGQNYGWPVAQGRNHPASFAAPVIVYDNTVAPSGATFYDDTAIPQWRGSLLFTALRGTHLHRVVFSDDDPRQVATDERLYDGEFGRLRDVVPGPDGTLYLLTSNRDGRGNPAAADDRVLRITPR